MAKLYSRIFVTWVDSSVHVLHLREHSEAHWVHHWHRRLLLHLSRLLTIAGYLVLKVLVVDMELLLVGGDGLGLHHDDLLVVHGLVFGCHRLAVVGRRARHLHALHATTHHIHLHGLHLGELLLHVGHLGRSLLDWLFDGSCYWLGGGGFLNRGRDDLLHDLLSLHFFSYFLGNPVIS